MKHLFIFMKIFIIYMFCTVIQYRISIVTNFQLHLLFKEIFYWSFITILGEWHFCFWYFIIIKALLTEIKLGIYYSRMPRWSYFSTMGTATRDNVAIKNEIFWNHFLLIGLQRFTFSESFLRCHWQT